MYLEVDLQIAPIEIRHFREIVSQYLSSVSVYYYLYTGKRIKFDFYISLSCTKKSDNHTAHYIIKLPIAQHFCL